MRLRLPPDVEDLNSSKAESILLIIIDLRRPMSGGGCTGTEERVPVAARVPVPTRVDIPVRVACVPVRVPSVPGRVPVRMACVPVRVPSVPVRVACVPVRVPGVRVRVACVSVPSGADIAVSVTAGVGVPRRVLVRVPGTDPTLACIVFPTTSFSIQDFKGLPSPIGPCVYPGGH